MAVVADGNEWQFKDYYLPQVRRCRPCRAARHVRSRVRVCAVCAPRTDIGCNQVEILFSKVVGFYIHYDTTKVRRGA